ncbi:MAG TPA: di-heme-cytochrome C peroxidase, partial [Acetobacteraceae bacterium]
RPPRWPEAVLGPIDAAAAERGRAQYARLCSGCHEGGWTKPDSYGHSYRQMRMVPVERIGTDPKAAMNFVNRRAYMTPAATKPVSAADGLREVTTAVTNRWYDDNDIPPADRVAMNGYRPNEWRALAAYQARSLNGIWATGPFLHNGSVPSLYQMLLPAVQRDAAFTTGSREFDPKHVGFDTTASETGFRFDTTIPGNSNRGHEFRNGPPGPGVLGPELTEQQRWDIVEYLKTL